MTTEQSERVLDRYLKASVPSATGQGWKELPKGGWRWANHDTAFSVLPVSGRPLYEVFYTQRQVAPETWKAKTWFAEPEAAFKFVNVEFQRIERESKDAAKGNGDGYYLPDKWERMPRSIIF